ncbi:hypothetical protein THIX_60354 [Thiomonas sp. X19]|nr:hypothetical protein THIX_60354 [Thiomonas sp. X19]
MQAQLKLALYPRRSLAHDAGMDLGSPAAVPACLAHNVASQAEVDAVMQEAQAASACIVKPGRATFWGGYAGYFQDPDGRTCGKWPGTRPGRFPIAFRPQLLRPSGRHPSTAEAITPPSGAQRHDP